MNRPVTGPRGSEQEERNREVVFDFYEHIILERGYERWPEFMRPDYIQHKPILIDGPQGVLDFMEENYARCKRHEPEIIPSFVDGDYVILQVQVHMEPYDRDIAVMDIFRVEGGLLAEHWDVDQPVPLEARNSNGVF